jgi:L-ascorbate metabolism protein UlaG (beta-lactamase superfamily)
MHTSIKHHHAVETYGMHFHYDGMRVAYLPCGRYFDGLAADYKAHKPDVLIVNVLRFSDAMNVDHLTWDDAKRVVEEVAPSVVIFQHFGTKMIEAEPGKLAQQLEDDLGIRAIAAYDGLEIDLDTEVAAVAG